MSIKLFKILLFNAITIALFGFTSCSSGSDDEVGNGVDGSTMVVKLSAAGTLASHIDDDVMYKITRLKVTGEINSTDIWLLRKMAGYETDGVLAYLDLSDARIVAGGRPYFEDDSTEDDVMTDHMFYKCPSLVSITCPNSVKEIEWHAFGQCAGLVNVELPSSLLKVNEPFYQDYYEYANLKSIKCKTMTPPNGGLYGGLYGGIDAKDRFFKNVILYVPKGSMNAYEKSLSSLYFSWGDFQNIEEY